MATRILSGSFANDPYAIRAAISGRGGSSSGGHTNLMFLTGSRRADLTNNDGR
jgi:hypothetical protein